MFFVQLGFEGDVTLLDQKVHLHRLPDRYTLAKEGEQLNKLFFVIKGSIVGYMKEIGDSKRERKKLQFSSKTNLFNSFFVFLQVLCLLIEQMKSAA